jgi:hypothetical protein
MELINRPHRPYFSPIPQSDDALDIIGNTGWIFSEIIKYGVTNTVKAHTEEYKYFLLFDFNTFIPKTLKLKWCLGWYFIFCIARYYLQAYCCLLLRIGTQFVLAGLIKQVYGNAR